MTEAINETVKLVLFLSLSGTLLAVILFALKPLIRKRLSKAFQYYIWFVVLLRFMLPISFAINLMDVSFSKSALVQNTNTAVTGDVPAENMRNISPVVHNNLSAPKESIPIQQPSMPIVTDTAVDKPFDVSKLITDNLLFLWLAGVVIAMIFNISAYLRFMHYLHGAAYPLEMPECPVRIYKSRFASTPMLAGIRKPRIYLPDMDFTKEQLNNILLHELTHLRRRDVLFKWFAALVVSLHWFNPIVYFIQRELNRACELSCDEAVIRGLDIRARQSYGNTLILVVAESRCKDRVISATMCEEKKNLKERLTAIMDDKKKTKITLVLTVLLAVVITGGALAFGAQGEGFSLWKSTVYSVAFPYERVSDIRPEDMTALILDKLNNPKADIYIYTDPQNIKLNTDYTLKEFVSEILVSEYQDGTLVYRPYQLRIFPNDKINIFPHDSVLAAGTEHRYCTFTDYWSALSSLPAEAISKTIMGEVPDFYSLHYTPYDRYENSSSELKHIFYDSSRVMENYSASPSVIFTFSSMYQEEADPGRFSGVGGTMLYYYNQQSVRSDCYAVNERCSITLNELRILAEKGGALGIEDFEKFEGSNIGFGLYIIHYTVEGGYSLLVGYGALTEKPWYARLEIPGVEEYIDIRQDDIDGFLNKYHVPNELNSQIYQYLDTITSSPASSSSPLDYIKEHKAEYDAVWNMGTKALPALTTILESGDRGLKGKLAASLVQNIIQLESEKPHSEWLDGMLDSARHSLERYSVDFAANDETPRTKEENPEDMIVYHKISTENVVAINISPTFTEREEELTRSYTSKTKIPVILNYLNDLTLYSNLPAVPVPENAEVVAYYISIYYGDGTIGEYLHFGRFFAKITEEGRDWLTMTYEESLQFEDIIKANPSD